MKIKFKTPVIVAGVKYQGEQVADLEDIPEGSRKCVMRHYATEHQEPAKPKTTTKSTAKGK